MHLSGFRRKNQQRKHFDGNIWRVTLIIYFLNVCLVSYEILAQSIVRHSFVFHDTGMNFVQNEIHSCLRVDVFT